MPAETPVLDVNQKRYELLALWEDVFTICKALVESAKKDPTKISASMLKEILSMLRQSNGLIDLMAHAQEVAEQSDDAPLSLEEQEMMNQFDEMERQRLREEALEDANHTSIAMTEMPFAAKFEDEDLYGLNHRGRK